MAEELSKDLLLYDPLSDVTRKERKLLLGVSLLAVTTGLVPTKISALGIEFGKTNQQALLVWVSFITMYFLAAFIIYAANDFLAWQKALYQEKVEAIREEDMREREGSLNHILMEEDRIGRMLPKPLLPIFRLVKPISILRAVFEFLLPVVFGIYSIAVIWYKVWWT